jgi:predicted O-linked N-acetylglucosamine transferase (SPINDLY family)
LPQSGGITILEGLWMGVPAVTLLGDVIAGRFAGALLHAAGLPELVARTPDAYVETAVRMTAALPRLAAQRGTLRDQLATSPVMDPRRFTAAVEDAYRMMWRRWCAGVRRHA